MQAAIEQIDTDLHLITLPPPIPGFQNFISVWLYGNSSPVMIDVGPAATVPALFNALDRMQIRNLSYILLTHIHIDHAGGIGEVAKRFTKTPVVCHEKAVPHLAAPDRLWAGSVRTLGDRAYAYGKIRPVPPAQIAAPDIAANTGIRAIPTPGHAPHHISFHAGSYLFIGETGGVRLPFSSGDDYLRPATPPPFFLETAVRSIDRLLQEPPAAHCYGHYGYKAAGHVMLAKHREQLFQWSGVVREEMKKEANDDRLVSNCMARLLREDPLIGRYTDLAPAVQNRERGFMENSLRGMIGHHRKKAAVPEEPNPPL